MPIRMAPGTRRAISTAITDSPKSVSSAAGELRSAERDERAGRIDDDAAPLRGR